MPWGNMQLEQVGVCLLSAGYWGYRWNPADRASVFLAHTLSNAESKKSFHDFCPPRPGKVEEARNLCWRQH